MFGAQVAKLGARLDVLALKLARSFSVLRLQSSPFKRFTSVEEINAYMDDAPNSSWDPSIYSKPPSEQTIEPCAASEINADDLKGLCSLSGLLYPSDLEEQNKLLESLNSQIHFLNHLHSTKHEKTTNNVQSLSNVIKSEKMSFEKLVSSVQHIEACVDVKKAEMVSESGDTNNISRLAKLHENDFYVVKP